jgi:PAS domain S-box-containing protein
MVATFTDITQWKRDQEALLRQEYKYRLLMEQSGDAIFMNAEDGRITEVNAHACQLLGYPREELLTLSEGDLLPAPGQAGVCTCFGQPQARCVVRRECQMCRKDGSLVHVEISVTPITPQWHMAIVRDITDRRRAQDRLLRAARMESIGRLAGGVAHDFNNLLAVISGYSESMLRRTEEGHPLRGHVQEIYRAASRGASLTQQLLAFSRQRPAALQVLDLSQAIHGVHAMIRRVISDKIEIELRASDPALIKADPGQIEQVLVNLALNARDAMPDGGRLVIATGSAEVGHDSIAGLPHGRYVRLSVRDTGAGMDADTRNHIFDPFFTTKEQTSEGGGTGLGLSIVYGIVRDAGGAITVRSELGHGAQFDVYFPVAQGE